LNEFLGFLNGRFLYEAFNREATDIIGRIDSFTKLYIAVPVSLGGFMQKSQPILI
jgi:hypothetical protein